MTLEEAEAQWKAANPFPQMISYGEAQDTGEVDAEGEPIYETVTVTRETTQAEYDAMATDRATMWLTNHEAQAARTAAQQELHNAKPVYQKLKTGSATANETQRFLALIGKHVYRLVGEDAEDTS